MKKLFLVVLGGKPEGRLVEQHDVAFVVAERIEDTYEVLRAHWPIPVHVDAYSAIEEVDGFRVEVVEGEAAVDSELKLYFVNLGGYKANDLEEYHKKLVLAAGSLEEAKVKAKSDVFAEDKIQDRASPPHVDDKAEVDDLLELGDLISPTYSIRLVPDAEARYENNKRHPVYVPLGTYFDSGSE